MPSTQFSVNPENDEGFYVIVADQLTVYESYDAAVEEVQEKISTDTDSFLAEVTIDHDRSDDVEISLEQVGWQQVIRDMTTDENTQTEESAP
jgi:hypothetical protein